MSSSVAVTTETPATTPASFFPAGSTPGDCWRLVFKDVEQQLARNLKAHRHAMAGAILHHHVPLAQASLTFREKCAITLGGWLGVAQTLFYMRIGFRLEPRRVLMIGTYEYEMQAMNNNLHCFWIFERYNGVTLGREAWIQQPFVHVRLVNFNYHGGSMGSEYFPTELSRGESKIMRHYRYWRRVIVQQAIRWVDGSSHHLYCNFAVFVYKYRL